MAERYEPKPLELNAPVIVPLTPYVGENYTDGLNQGCYLEIYDKLMIVHIAIKNVDSQGYVQLSILGIPSTYKIRNRTYGAGAWGPLGLKPCFVAVSHLSMSQIMVYKSDNVDRFTDYITGTLVCTLE